MRDSIDFKNMDIAALFRKLLLPTVLGMIFSALFVITDGIFVGKGIGSDALAAVNIVAPLWLFSTGIGLMFGVGASVVASIHLSHNKPKTARINITQSIVVSSLLLMCTSTLFCLFAPQVVHLLGSSERLKPLAVEYMCWFVPFSAFTALLNSGMFFLRLDGSPNFAMFCNYIAEHGEVGRTVQLRHVLQYSCLRSEHHTRLSVYLPFRLGNVRCGLRKCHRNNGRSVNDYHLSFTAQLCAAFLSGEVQP